MSAPCLAGPRVPAHVAAAATATPQLQAAQLCSPLGSTAVQAAAALTPRGCCLGRSRAQSFEGVPGLEGMQAWEGVIPGLDFCNHAQHAPCRWAVDPHRQGQSPAVSRTAGLVVRWSLRSCPARQALCTACSLSSCRALVVRRTTAVAVSAVPCVRQARAGVAGGALEGEPAARQRDPHQLWAQEQRGAAAALRCALPSPGTAGPATSAGSLL